MRRFFVGLAIIAMLGLVPCKARGNDRQIARQIVSSLEQHKENGTLTDFNIELEVEDGSVYLKGRVINVEQQRLALEVARKIEGVRQVHNELEILGGELAEPNPLSGDNVRLASASDVDTAPTADTKKPARISDSSTADKAQNTAISSQELAERIYARLKQEKDRGRLKGFSLDLEVDGSIASLKGRVASAEQQNLVLEAVRRVPGVTQVVNGLAIDRPAAAQPDLAAKVISQLQAKKARGELRDFGVDVEVEDGIVWLSGYVASEEQRRIVLDTARYMPGVAKVVNDLTIKDPRATTRQTSAITNAPSDDPEETNGRGTPPRTLSEGPIGSSVAEGLPQPSVPAPQLASSGIPGSSQVRYVWVPAAQAQAAARNSQTPLAFAPAQQVNYQAAEGAPVSGEPMPMNAGMPGVGIAPARFDHPQLPQYAWPSYAPYPNYGAVTYPKQYSPMAWPYIGPFYPYPQVPLGWRKVSLEWKDGWWQLDFKSRHH